MIYFFTKNILMVVVIVKQKFFIMILMFEIYILLQFLCEQTNNLEFSINL